MRSFQFNIESQTSASWLDRAQKCAQLIFSIEDVLGANPSLADVGCGDQKLRNFLMTETGGVKYQGYDIYPQSSDVIKFDANADDLLVDFDIIVSLGLTEYVDLRKFLHSMRRRCRFFVVSHVLRNFDLYGEAALNKLGWINHLSAEDFEVNLLSARFKVLQTAMTKNNKTQIWLCG